MKKTALILLLVIVLTLSIAVPAFADPPPDKPPWNAKGVYGEYASSMKCKMGMIAPYWMSQGGGYKWGPIWSNCYK